MDETNKDNETVVIDETKDDGTRVVIVVVKQEEL